VTFVDGKGATVMLRSSKTDQTGIGEVLPVRYRKPSIICPVRALEDWLAVRGSKKPGPLFLQVKRDRLAFDRMGDESINQVVKKAADRAGLKGGAYGAHSLRAGFVTSAHVYGADILTIMNITGHKSTAMVKKYLRNRDPFAAPDPFAQAV
jgi:integrase